MASLSGELIAWSRRRARPLPWRGARDPYRIWVSEIMLQQTRTETVVSYYRRFLKKFPTAGRLARSGLSSVLKAWEGLGYYSRARNLHRAAILLAERGGRLPRTAAEWEELPGVGRYTAAAIASLAFEQPAAALDANARRILVRLYAYRRTVADERSRKELTALYHDARGAAAPGAFFQALMDLGQLVCVPRGPLCGECPVAKECASKKLGIQNRPPTDAARGSTPHFDVTAAVIFRAGRVLIARRPEGKLLGGMWEFTGGKRERGETLPACLRRELKEELGVTVRVRERILKVEHAFSHFRITLHVFRCDGLRGAPKPIGAAEVRWVRIRDLRRYPMGKADRITAETIWKCSCPRPNLPSP
jgi:A/G-specific adenine glycosylase